MLGFMDYVQNAFHQATGWNRDNSYGSLTATSRNLLDFETPTGLRFHVSSLSSPNFASSYTLGSIGVVDGSLSYLYTSRALQSLASSSKIVDLRYLVPGYRYIQDLQEPEEASSWQVWRDGQLVGHRHDTLLYGRLFLPRSTLEALYMRRLNPKTQIKISCVSDSRLPNGGTILAHIQHDAARHCTEYIYSTDSALFGVRGLYNFGPDPAPRPQPQSQLTSPNPIIDVTDEAATVISSSSSTLSALPSRPNGQFSIGGEVYYGLLNKSGGLSTGLRFATLPSHPGFPYTMTFTINPLMGNLSSTYSVVASPLLALSSRFDFNVYSYESELQIGAELWRRKARPALEDFNWARRKMGIPLLDISPLDADESVSVASEDISGCLKACVDQKGHLALLWEGKLKELLYSCGMTIDAKGGENMFRGFGIEFQYSS